MGGDEQTNGNQDRVGDVDIASVEDNELLLRMLVSGLAQPLNPVENSKPLDLSLRLSVGGACEGNQNETAMKRSSSLFPEINLKQDCGKAGLPKDFLSLARCSSLPVDLELGKREFDVKDLQIGTRDEGKNVVMEKENISTKGKQVLKQEEVPGKMPTSTSKVAAWAAASAARNPALNRALAKIKEGFRKQKERKSQAASKSKASITRSFSEPQRKLEKVAESSQRKRKLEMELESLKKRNGKSIMLPTESKVGNPPKRAKVSDNADKDIGMEIMKSMPSVTTTGPTGRRVEGFLYRYLQGQVKIVCLCHGSFLSPEEFVKHAGGIDILNPMKHISVIQNSFTC
ncbi:hypothetical protein SLE2022_291740 [Rubroshorea leprosula]